MNTSTLGLDLLFGLAIFLSPLWIWFFFIKDGKKEKDFVSPPIQQDPVIIFKSAKLVSMKKDTETDQKVVIGSSDNEE